MDVADDEDVVSPWRDGVCQRAEPGRILHEIRFGPTGAVRRAEAEMDRVREDLSTTRPPADRRPGRLRRPCWSCGPFWTWNPRGPGLTTMFDVGRVAVGAAA